MHYKLHPRMAMRYGNRRLPSRSLSNTCAFSMAAQVVTLCHNPTSRCRERELSSRHPFTHAARPNNQGVVGLARIDGSRASTSLMLGTT
jgi:hypothetical protein